MLMNQDGVPTNIWKESDNNNQFSCDELNTQNFLNQFILFLHDMKKKKIIKNGGLNLTNLL